MFGKEKPPKRFKKKYEESFDFGAIVIVVDTQTGVNYISTVGTSLNSFTPLLDSNGEVVIDPIDSL